MTGVGPLFEPPAAPPLRSDHKPHAPSPAGVARKPRNRVGRVALGLRLNPDVYEQLRDLAFRERLPMQALVEEGIALMLQSRQQR